MEAKPHYLLVFSTCPDQDSARQIADTVVAEKFAACVNIIPGVVSCFSWQEKIKTENELLLIMKTTLENYAGLEQLVKDLHPYELPELIAVPIGAGLGDYLDWITSNTR